MLKRAVSLVTLVAFLAATWSCAVHTTIPTGPQRLAQGPRSLRIKGILTKSGERITFQRTTSARYDGDRIFVNESKATLTVAEADVEESTVLDGGRRKLLLKNGLECTGQISELKAGTITIVASSLAVPMSQVDTVWVEHTDGGRVFLVTLGAVAATLGAIFLIALLTKESCPFVYSYDGTTYMLDGEPYGGATCPGLKRTDWGGLKHAKEVGGEYRFKVTNEVDETQHTDEMKLVVVDHPGNVTVVADEAGALHSLAAPVGPTSAVDGRGRDILDYVKDDDWVYWQSALVDLDPEAKSGLKERLVFEFPKPSGARRAKLVFDGGNTLWASQMVKRFLSLQGRNLDRYYASLAAPGAAQFALLSLNLREELYRLNLRVSTPSGWVVKGSAVGGGPFVTRARTYSLDISDVPGDVLKIELTPPLGFWMINHVAVDYSEDVPLEVREVGAARAVDSHGADLRDALSSVDGRYFTMPSTGDSADLVFQAPPRSPGLERSVLLKTNGYYDIHMGTLGDPMIDTLARVRTEPGFAIRFALQEFAKWRSEHATARALHGYGSPMTTMRD